VAKLNTIIIQHQSLAEPEFIYKIATASKSAEKNAPSFYLTPWSTSQTFVLHKTRAIGAEINTRQLIAASNATNVERQSVLVA